MDRFRDAVESLRTTWVALPASYKVLTVLLGVLLAVSVTWGFRAAESTGWTKVLDASADADVRARALSALEDLGIPREVRSGSLYVATAQADEAVLKLHGRGVMGDGQVFDFIKETTPFASQWDKDKRWQVALQQQLARMIGRMDPVKAVSVQVTPQSEMRTLGWAGAEATAAVFVELKPHAELSPANVRAIAGLAAAAVPGLKPSNVKIGDSQGRLYSLPSAAAASSGGDLRDQELEYARALEQKARNLLPEGSKVSVTVRLSPEDRSTEKKTVDRPVIETETQTTNTKETDPSGRTTETKQSSSRTAHGQTVERVQAPLGTRIDSVSVAVVIPVAEGDAGSRTVADYTPLLSRATGADERSVSVLLVPVPRLASVPPPAPEPGTDWSRAAGQIGLALLAIALIGVAWRAARGLGTAGVVSEESRGRPGEPLAAAAGPEAGTELDRMRDSVREQVERDPRSAAEVLRRWMR